MENKDFKASVIINGQEMSVGDSAELDVSTVDNSELVMPVAPPREMSFECKLKEPPSAQLFEMQMFNVETKHKIGQMVWIWQTTPKQKERKHSRGGYYIRATITQIKKIEGEGVLNETVYKVTSKKKGFFKRKQRMWWPEDQVFAKKPKTAPNKFFDFLRHITAVAKVASSMAKIMEIQGHFIGTGKKFTAAAKVAETIIDAYTCTQTILLEIPKTEVTK